MLPMVMCLDYRRGVTAASLDAVVLSTLFPDNCGITTPTLNYRGHTDWRFGEAIIQAKPRIRFRFRISDLVGKIITMHSWILQIWLLVERPFMMKRAILFTLRWRHPVRLYMINSKAMRSMKTRIQVASLSRPGITKSIHLMRMDA